jgi:hypothetical protein
MSIVPAVFTGAVAWLGIELVRAGRDRVADR